MAWQKWRTVQSLTFDVSVRWVGMVGGRGREQGALHIRAYHRLCAVIGCGPCAAACQQDGLPPLSVLTQIILVSPRTECESSRHFWTASGRATVWSPNKADREPGWAEWTDRLTISRRTRLMSESSRRPQLVASYPSYVDSDSQQLHFTRQDWSGWKEIQRINTWHRLSADRQACRRRTTPLRYIYWTWSCFSWSCFAGELCCRVSPLVSSNNNLFAQQLTTPSP